MKKIILPILLFIGAAFIFSSCKKDNPATPENVTTLRYEFTSDVDGHYSIAYTADSSANSEEINSRSWSKTMQVSRNSVNTATLTVYPPVDWQGTTITANATVKIFVDGVEKASQTGFLTGLDRPTGITASATVQ